MLRTRVLKSIGIASFALVVSFGNLSCSDGDEVATDKDEPKDEPPRALNIMQWDHFVPEYKAWTDNFTEVWGKDTDVKLTLEWVDSAELVNRL
ncbi:MAG: hypothetical protein RJA70_4541, partial [Pseudomonadota bacterium]